MINKVVVSNDNGLETELSRAEDLVILKQGDAAVTIDIYELQDALRALTMCRLKPVNNYRNYSRY